MNFHVFNVHVFFANKHAIFLISQVFDIKLWFCIQFSFLDLTKISVPEWWVHYGALVC